MRKILQGCAIALLTCVSGVGSVAADRLSWPSTLPVYDHIVIVVEENKDFGQIFDENDDKDQYHGLTNPQVSPGPAYPPLGKYNQHLLDLQNRIVTIFAGAHIRPGLKADAYAEGKGITHVNILRTIEAMYGLPKSGAQQPNAAGAGISDETIVTDIFEPLK